MTRTFLNTATSGCVLTTHLVHSGLNEHLTRVEKTLKPRIGYHCDSVIVRGKLRALLTPQIAMLARKTKIETSQYASSHLPTKRLYNPLLAR